MKKSLLLTGAFALFSLVASAKTYDIALTGPAMAGSVQLAPGEYHVKVVGNNAVFTDQNNFKQFTAPVKVVKTAGKFDTTAVDSNKQNGTDRIQKIELGGSNTELDFSD